MTDSPHLHPQMADSTEFRAKNEGYLKGITASYQLKHCDPRFSELRTYADELETRINALLKVTQNIAVKHRQSYNHYKDFGKTFRLLAWNLYPIICNIVNVNNM